MFPFEAKWISQHLDRLQPASILDCGSCTKDFVASFGFTIEDAGYVDWPEAQERLTISMVLARLG